MSLTTERKRRIPEVSKEKLDELSKRIKPVYNFSEGGSAILKRGLRYIKPVDIYDVAYTWGPKAAGKAKGLKSLADIITYHTYGYYGFFKPSIAEVLAQIPEEYLDKVVAFEIVDRPETAEDLNKDMEALNEGYHVAKTRLYVRD